jgi:hypothetical protein
LRIKSSTVLNAFESTSQNSLQESRHTGSMHKVVILVSTAGLRGYHHA